ncbi:MAG: methylated-DNA--[protein]-cysteine S-methyltransferase [Brachymonas sp.]|nr:methylated-DNA--[protein]-cysteine S-methyltransferase [Brachymonas sp.]
MPITDPALVRRYFTAFVERDPEYVGLFYVAVRTTGIFCISTCRARKPKMENVQFFGTTDGPLQAGYRPCKICRPTQHSYLTPPAVTQALALLRQQPNEKFTDARLQQHGISPSALRRWFRTRHGMSFQAYQRAWRINEARLALQQGASSLDTASDAGYASLSGFNAAYKKLMGHSPMQDTTHTLLAHRFDTPLGEMLVCATDTGICLLEFEGTRRLQKELDDIQRLFGAKIMVGENTYTRQAEREMQEYFRGERRDFTVPLQIPGTPFQQQVWRYLITIPYGQTVSYQAEAQAIGKPDAVRPAATANGANRISVIIPCHRVIGKNGQLTGYGGGLQRKQWLLDHERRVLGAEAPLPDLFSAQGG